MKTGDIYTFGSFPQSPDGEKAPIEWKVLCVDEHSGRALLLSRYALTAMRFADFDPSSETVVPTWSNSGIRSYLNGEFINDAFTAEELEDILFTHVTADPDPSHDAFQGNGTEDRIFLLSTAEAEKYLPELTDRCCRPTPYAVSQGIHLYRYDEEEGLTDKLEEFDGNVRWWLRTMGSDRPGFAAQGSPTGMTGSFSIRVSHSTVGVRPALWYRIKIQEDRK